MARLQHRTTFLDLPLELRYQIYTIVLGNISRTVYWRRCNRFRTFYAKGALLQVNKQIRKEATVAYEENLTIVVGRSTSLTQLPLVYTGARKLVIHAGGSELERYRHYLPKIREVIWLSRFSKTSSLDIECDNWNEVLLMLNGTRDEAVMRHFRDFIHARNYEDVLPKKPYLSGGRVFTLLSYVNVNVQLMESDRMLKWKSLWLFEIELTDWKVVDRYINWSPGTVNDPNAWVPFGKVVIGSKGLREATLFGQPHLKFSDLADANKCPKIVSNALQNLKVDTPALYELSNAIFDDHWY